MTCFCCSSDMSLLGQPAHRCCQGHEFVPGRRYRTAMFSSILLTASAAIFFSGTADFRQKLRLLPDILYTRKSHVSDGAINSSTNFVSRVICSTFHSFSITRGFESLVFCLFLHFIYFFFIFPSSASSLFELGYTADFLH